MKKIILFVSVSFVFLLLNISVAQAACTVNNHNYSECFHGNCSPTTFVNGFANAKEDNPGDCRASCKAWGNSTYPFNTSYQFKTYHYKRFSNLDVNCSVSTKPDKWTSSSSSIPFCPSAPSGGVSECNY